MIFCTVDCFVHEDENPQMRVYSLVGLLYGCDEEDVMKTA